MLFRSLAAFGLPNLLNGTFPFRKATRNPSQGGTGKEINASKRHLRLIFLEKVPPSKDQISPQKQKRTHALSLKRRNTRAREREKERKKSTRRKVFICILFYRRLRWIYARRRRKSTAASLSLCKQLKSQRRRDIPFSGKCKRRQSPGERRRIRVPPVRKREK